MDAAFLQSLLPADAGVRITDLALDPAVVEVRLATTGEAAPCPRCRSVSATVHGRYRGSVPPADERAGGGGEGAVACRVGHPGREYRGERPVRDPARRDPGPGHTGSGHETTDGDGGTARGEAGEAGGAIPAVRS